jgi:hypothetical protein
MHREAAAAGQGAQARGGDRNVTTTNPTSQNQNIQAGLQNQNQTQSNGNSSPPTQQQQGGLEVTNTNNNNNSLTTNQFLNQQAQASLASSVMYQQQQWQQAQAMYAYWNMYNVYNAALSNHLMQQQGGVGVSGGPAAAAHHLQAMSGPMVCSPSVGYPGAAQLVNGSPTMLKVQQQGGPRVPLVMTPALKVQEAELQLNGSTNSMNSTSTTVTQHTKRAEGKHSKKRHQHSHDKIRKTDEHRKMIKKGTESSYSKVCSNCGTSSTPFWRKNKIGGLPLCNACGLYYSKNDAQRPKELWKQEDQHAHTIKPLS